MPTSDEMVELTIPTRGMNLDRSASQLAPNEASNLFNYVPGEPGQLRLRNGLKRKDSCRATLFAANSVGYDAVNVARFFYSTPSMKEDNTVPIGYAVYGDHMMITWADYAHASDPAKHAEPVGKNYRKSESLLSGENAVYKTMWYNIATNELLDPYNTGYSSGFSDNFWRATDYVGTNTHPTTGIQTGTYPNGTIFGRGVAFDQRVYWCSPMILSYSRRFDDWTLTSWAGGVPVQGMPSALDASNKYSLKINNGETNIVNNESANELSVLKAGRWQIKPDSSNTTLVTAMERGYSYIVFDDGNASPAVDARLSFPYGRGATTGTVPHETHASNDNFFVSPFQSVNNSPYGVMGLNVFQDRLFAFAGGNQGLVLSGKEASFYPNLVSWSTGNGDEWPYDQYFFIDDAATDVLVGAGTVAGLQPIFSFNKTYVMSGYDENSFEVDTLYGFDGCIDNLSINTIDDRLYWMGNSGLYSWGGSGLPRQESHPNSATGIRSELTRWLDPAETDVTEVHRKSSVERVDNFVVFSVYNALRKNVNHPYVYNPQSGSFAKWGIGSISAPEGDATPYMFAKVGLKTFAVGSFQVWDITNIFREPVLDGGTVAQQTQDEYFNTSDASASSDIAGRVQFRDLIVRPGRTVRVREFIVEHACIHDGANDAFDLKFGRDPSQGTSSSTLKTVDARDYDGGGSIEYDNGKYYTERIPITGANIPVEGQLFRVTLDKPATSGYRNDGGHKIYRVYARLSVTREGRVDPTMT